MQDCVDKKQKNKTTFFSLWWELCGSILKKPYPRGCAYVLTRSGWQDPGMRMPDWNENKRSLKRRWGYFAWERDVNDCSQRVEGLDCTRRIWLQGYMPPHVFFYVILLLVHQDVGSMFPLCERVWTCDYRRRDATWLLSHIVKGDTNLPSPLFGMLILRI